MKKSNFILSAMCLVASTVVNGQGTATKIADIKGTPYVEADFTPGVIYYANKKLEVPIRYNAFQDLIEYQQSGRALVLDPSETIKKVCFGTLKFVPQKFELKGKPKLGYLAMLDSGKVILYSRKQVTFLPMRKGGALDGSDQPAEFKWSADTFYYKIGEGELQEVESIKSMIAGFPDKQDELTQFAKKEKISPRKEKEIIQFVQYYNSL
jgi:hypothetical protein